MDEKTKLLYNNKKMLENQRYYYKNLQNKLKAQIDRSINAEIGKIDYQMNNIDKELKGQKLTIEDLKYLDDSAEASHDFDEEKLNETAEQLIEIINRREEKIKEEPGEIAPLNQRFLTNFAKRNGVRKRELVRVLKFKDVDVDSIFMR